MMYSSTLFLKDTQKYELSYLLRTLRIHICMYIIQHMRTFYINTTYMTHTNISY